MRGVFDSHESWYSSRPYKAEIDLRNKFRTTLQAIFEMSGVVLWAWKAAEWSSSKSDFDFSVNFRDQEAVSRSPGLG